MGRGQSVDATNLWVTLLERVMISLTLTVQREVKNDAETNRRIKQLEKEGWTVDVSNEEDLEDDVQD